MGSTNIEYIDRTWNFYYGCLHKQQGVCPIPHCWAWDMDKRFGDKRFYPRLIPEKLLEPLKWKKPARVGVCFTGDLFGDWVDPRTPSLLKGFSEEGSDMGNWTLRQTVEFVVNSCPQHTFVFLTKAPLNLLKWSPFPKNCYIGVSVCKQNMLNEAIVGLAGIKAKVKFISVEPLRERITFPSAYDLTGIDWVIIGSWSRYSSKTAPKIEWIKAIVNEADRVGAKVFLKANLVKPLWESRPGWAFIDDHHVQLRQEFPR